MWSTDAWKSKSLTKEHYLLPVCNTPSPPFLSSSPLQDIPHPMKLPWAAHLQLLILCWIYLCHVWLTEIPSALPFENSYKGGLQWRQSWRPERKHNQRNLTSVERFGLSHLIQQLNMWVSCLSTKPQYLWVTLSQMKIGNWDNFSTFMMAVALNSNLEDEFHICSYVSPHWFTCQ